MKTEAGETVGRHIGLAYYTPGQRKGLGIGGRGDGRRWFVLDKDLANNVLVVGQGEDHPRLFSRRAEAEELTWIAGTAPMPEGKPLPLHGEIPLPAGRPAGFDHPGRGYIVN